MTVAKLQDGMKDLEENVVGSAKETEVAILSRNQTHRKSAMLLLLRLLRLRRPLGPFTIPRY